MWARLDFLLSRSQAATQLRRLLDRLRRLALRLCQLLNGFLRDL
jgi:hypothetical protein